MRKFINVNYKTDGELTFRTDASSGKIIVDCSSSVELNRDIPKLQLTDGTFEWGEIKGNFNCRNYDNLTSLEGAPKEVGKNFSCYNCYSLESLEGAPKYVGKHFNYEFCDNLTSLKGAPKKVGGCFTCCYCPKLKSLEGAPEK